MNASKHKGDTTNKNKRKTTLSNNTQQQNQETTTSKTTRIQTKQTRPEITTRKQNNKQIAINEHKQTYNKKNGEKTNKQA